MKSTFVFLFTAFWLGLLIGGVFAQEAHNHPPQDVEAHEKFYANWMRPYDREISCCNKQDCYPTEFKRVGGTWFAKRREDGEWIAIPENTIEHDRDGPDGRNHVCMQPPGSVNAVFCAKIGGGI